MATAREGLAHVDDESLGSTILLGAALWALPHGHAPDEEAPETATARAQVPTPLTELGWSTTLELGELSPVYRSLVASAATLVRLGHPCDIGYLTRQARSTERATVRRLAQSEESARRYGLRPGRQQEGPPPR